MNRIQRWFPQAVPWVVLVLAASAVPAVIFLPPVIAPELDDPRAQFEVLDRARLTVAAVIGGLGVLAGAYINWRRVSALEQQVATMERGQITDRFTRAIDQLGAVRPDNTPAPEIRAGGVRSLERIARESPEDFAPILDILTAYLRSESPVPSPDVESLWDRAHEIRLRMDVAFTIEAIQRLWPGEHEPASTPLNLFWTFAPRIAFRGKNLERGNLMSAYLRIADLQGARLGGADLRSADLQLADLSAADLRGAKLSGAKLIGADLSTADLRFADLTGTDLQKAQLAGTDLRHTDLRLTSLEDARHDEETRWPEAFDPPPTHE